MENNRPIKFRALINKRFQNEGKWLYFNLEDLFQDEAIGQYTYNIDSIVHKTICQWTGLVDKKDTPIYEGDIVRYSNLTGDLTLINIVKFEDGTFTLDEAWDDGDHDWRSMENYSKWDMEVIGDIFSNPELLHNDNANEK